MGSRGRSIRLRIYFLVAIPLVTMIGMLGYVVATTVDNAINMDRAPDLISATAVPAAKFINLLQDERRAAVVYLSVPTAANGQQYDAAIAATNNGETAFRQAMSSSGTTGSEGGTEAQAIGAVSADLSQLGALRGAVQRRLLTPLDALAAYSKGIADEPKLFLSEANSVTTNVPAAGQSLGVIATAQAREGLSQEDALLAGALAAHRMTLAERSAFNQAAAQRQVYQGYAESILNQANLAAFNAQLDENPAGQRQLSTIEQAMAVNTPVVRLGVTPASWQALTGSLLTEYFNGGINAAATMLAADHHNSHQAWVEVAVVSGAGLLGLLVTILVTTLVARGIIRRLGGLERSALTLAEDQLPDVIARLRRGEEVDVAAEAPPLEAGPGGPGGDEIGRVGQAFDLVRQTAIRAAVEEAKLRRGLNDVFRSLARRSQSLLHRQLTLLDQMERRATDPEALDDLFRLDHLTTRMRRHAEGLVILAGAPPGRGWSSPVRMVDVMRGAIAEVEDYARVSVATRSQAALAGSAVADVIHLLAELVENATTLSPPYTSVRVSGDTVANGFAIEVEDRGLGMSPQRLADLNERLARPPEFNPADSEQLGLFVVGQLAKRHGIKVTLKASPFGGTSAIVLIPRHLVVTEDAFRAGLPGEPAAIGAVGPPANGNHAAELAGSAGFLPLHHAPELDGPGAPAVRISGALRRSHGSTPEGPSRGAHAAGPRAGSGAEAGPEPGVAPRSGQAGAAPQPGQVGAAPQPGRAGVAAGEPANGPEQPDFDVFVPRRHAGPDREFGLPAYPDPAPYSGAGSAPYRDQPFPEWTGRSAGRPSGAGAPGPAAPTTPMVPVASPRTGPVSGPPWELSRQTGPLPVVPADADPGSQPAGAGAGGDVKGLPRRVKQASLAPQLRADPPLRGPAAGAGPAGGPTPTEIRQTMSALQRGWQVGRLQNTAGPASYEAAPEPAAGSDTPSGQEPRGESDGA
jgi:signal transduction histidine kinase